MLVTLRGWIASEKCVAAKRGLPWYTQWIWCLLPSCLGLCLELTRRVRAVYCNVSIHKYWTVFQINFIDWHVYKCGASEPPMRTFSDIECQSYQGQQIKTAEFSRHLYHVGKTLEVVRRMGSLYWTSKVCMWPGHCLKRGKFVRIHIHGWSCGRASATESGCVMRGRDQDWLADRKPSFTRGIIHGMAVKPHVWMHHIT